MPSKRSPRGPSSRNASRSNARSNLRSRGSRPASSRGSISGPAFGNSGVFHVAQVRNGLYAVACLDQEGEPCLGILDLPSSKYVCFTQASGKPVLSQGRLEFVGNGREVTIRQSMPRNLPPVLNGKTGRALSRSSRKASARPKSTTRTLARRLGGRRLSKLAWA
jgi:hypothetical protein